MGYAHPECRRRDVTIGVCVERESLSLRCEEEFQVNDAVREKVSSLIDSEFNHISTEYKSVN